MVTETSGTEATGPVPLGTDSLGTGSRVRALLRSGAGPVTRGIDLQTVIRRSKARRLPKQLTAGGVFTLAIGGIGFAGLQGVTGGQGIATMASDSAADSQRADSQPGDSQRADGGDLSEAGSLADGGIKRAPAEKLNFCGGELAEVAPGASGLVLTVHFPDAAVGSPSVDGTVTITNTGGATVAGYTAASPAITLSQNRIVLWHSNGPTVMVARELTLAPGESAEYPASFSPIICAGEDDMQESFRAGLPAAPAGQYEVSAAIDFLGDSPAELVTGPIGPVTLR